MRYKMAEDIQSYAGGSKAFNNDLLDRSSQTHFLAVRCSMASHGNKFERRVGCIVAVFFFRVKTHASDMIRVHVLAP